MSPTQQLLRQTATRLWLARLGRRWFQTLLVLSALALFVLLAARLLGLLTIGFVPLAVAALPVLALVVALVLARRPSDRETARVVDTQAGAKDLFLTATLLGETPGEYQPIVVSQAELRAAELQPAKIVPWRWAPTFGQAVVALAIVLAALRWLPQLDPLKKVEQRAQASRQAEQLQESRKLTTLRAATLATETQKQAEQVKQALTDLDKAFKETKPPEKEANMERFGAEQRRLGDLWRKVNNTQLQQALEKGTQNFGQMDSQKLNEWREQLKKGDLSGIKRDLDGLKEALKRLAAEPDSADKRARQEELSRQLSKLAETMKQLLNSPQLNEALSRALAQMDAAKQDELSQEALEGAMESLQLSEKEMEQLSQALKDGRSLEDALKSLQMAKQLAAIGKLDGESLKDMQGMEDYAALFAQKMAEMGMGGQQGGPNMGPGQGDGSKRPENDLISSGFKSEKSSTALNGGKMLLEWKTKEVGDSGTRAEEFRDAVRGVKQGVSEALQAEQVPPGYHEAIKKYFDTLPEKSAAN